MMTAEMLIERMNHIRALVDPNVSPETASFLEDCRHPEARPIHYLVNVLVNCDRTKAMLPELFDFIVELYEAIIDLYDDDDYEKACEMHT